MLQGHLPGKLTEKGKKQIGAAADILAQEDMQFRCIVTSDQKRAVDSADIIAERLSLPVVPMEILRERDWANTQELPCQEPW